MAGDRMLNYSTCPFLARTLVLDNGAHTLKAGFTTDTSSFVDPPRIIPNCLARDRHDEIFVASELGYCRDFGDIQFRRPVDKGYIVNWEAQKQVWDREFFDEDAPQKCDPAETRLLLAEAPNSLPSLQTNCDQIVFEEYQFASYHRCPSPTWNTYTEVQSILQQSPLALQHENVQLPAEILLIIDSGYSHTTVTPILSGRPLHSAVRRLDVGGKLMTNYLTRLLSMRHFDMRNDSHLVNDIKEAACYVSQDFDTELNLCWKGTREEERKAWLQGGGIAKDYILPDFRTRKRGIMVDYDPIRHAQSRISIINGCRAKAADEDLLTLRNERFSVPEILFTPSDIGLRQPGLPDVVMQSLAELPIGLWPSFLANILVIGGSSRIPGFIDRLQKEILQRAPDECLVQIRRPEDPTLSTWLGGAALSKHKHVERLAVTKQQYDEHGALWVTRRFRDRPIIA